jgi:hypothetical protein
LKKKIITQSKKHNQLSIKNKCPNYYNKNYYNIYIVSISFTCWKKKW